jgi:hypothetical protein
MFRVFLAKLGLNFIGIIMIFIGIYLEIEFFGAFKFYWYNYDLYRNIFTWKLSFFGAFKLPHIHETKMILINH